MFDKPPSQPPTDSADDSVDAKSLGDLPCFDYGTEAGPGGGLVGRTTGARGV